MPVLKPVQRVCPVCKKSFARMQGDVVLPTDLNPLCHPCTLKKMIRIGKNLLNGTKKKR